MVQAPMQRFWSRNLVSHCPDLDSRGVENNNYKASVRSQLPLHWEWVFPQAEHICDASPGVEIWPGPYRNYFIVPSVETMANTYDWLYDIIDSDGPFDGVIGFSEVCHTVLLRSFCCLTHCH